MKINRYTYYFLTVLMLISTLSFLSKQSFAQESNNKFTSADSVLITVLVAPCSNGYNYQTYGFDLNPSIEKYLSTIESIKITPMSFKKMKGYGYQGVFDKKYCDRILQMHDIDYIVMTRIEGDYSDRRNIDNDTWGYQTKILETSTMTQFNGISAKGLKSYKDIDLHIKQNIYKLEKLLTKNKKTAPNNGS